MDGKKWTDGLDDDAAVEAYVKHAAATLATVDYGKKIEDSIPIVAQALT